MYVVTLAHENLGKFFHNHTTTDSGISRMLSGTLGLRRDQIAKFFEELANVSSNSISNDGWTLIASKKAIFSEGS